MKLVAISNHPVEKWDDNQKMGYEKIVHIPFPNVPATSTAEEVESMVEDLINQIRKVTGATWYELDGWGMYALDPKGWTISIQGEFSLCYRFVSRTGIIPVIPTTERITTEKDGIKTSVFAFVRWR